jgi:hypothetical protein
MPTSLGRFLLPPASINSVNLLHSPHVAATMLLHLPRRIYDIRRPDCISSMLLRAFGDYKDAATKADNR